MQNLSTDSIDNVAYYSISSRNLTYTGYDNYANDEIEENIFFTIVDDKCYFVLISNEFVNQDEMTIKDEFINVIVRQRDESFNHFLVEFAQDIGWNYDALREASAPILLSTVSYNRTLYQTIFFVLLFLLAYSIVVIFRYILIAAFPLLSPQFGKKHRHDSDIINSRYEFSALLQAELDDFLFKADNLYITPNYLINLVHNEIYVIPINKLCFIFEHGNVHKFLWFYMKVTHTIYLLCSNSLKCHFAHKHTANIDYILNMLKQMIPDLMIGYSAENQAKYAEIIKANKASK